MVKRVNGAKIIERDEKQVLLNRYMNVQTGELVDPATGKTVKSGICPYCKEEFTYSTPYQKMRHYLKHRTGARYYKKEYKTLDELPDPTLLFASKAEHKAKLVMWDESPVQQPASAKTSRSKKEKAPTPMAA